MYAQHADKLIDLLRGSNETINKSTFLLDSLVDSLPDDDKPAFRKSFSGIIF